MRALPVLMLLVLGACVPATADLETEIDSQGRPPGVVPIVEPAGAI